MGNTITIDENRFAVLSAIDDDEDDEQANDEEIIKEMKEAEAEFKESRTTTIYRISRQ